MKLLCMLFGCKEDDREEIKIFQSVNNKKVIKSHLMLKVRCKRCGKHLHQRMIENLSLKQLVEELI